MFIVKTNAVLGADPYYLRATTWTMRKRAQRFETREAAKAALEKARQFMKPIAFRNATIEEVEA